MNKIFFLLFLTANSYAGYTLDLTDPQFIEIADMYPSYQVLTSVNFNDTENNSTLVGFQTNKNSGEWDSIFSARIGSSSSGEQRIYINLAKTCSDNTLTETTTVKTNGRNVRYTRYCDGENIYLTPLSKAGDNFLINEFKRKENVRFEFSDIVILFDATGFTKAWNDFGGNAL